MVTKTRKLKVIVVLLATVALIAGLVAFFQFRGSSRQDDDREETSATPTPLPIVQLGPGTLRLDLIAASPEDLKAFLSGLTAGQMFQALDPSCGRPSPGGCSEVYDLRRRMDTALLYCSQISTDVFRRLPVYRAELHEEILSAFDEACRRLNRAAAHAGPPVDNEFWRTVQRDAARLVKIRPDWATDLTPVRDIIHLNLREVGEFLYHTLRGYLEGPAYCSTLGPPRSVTLGCLTRMDFPERMASVIAQCEQLYSREAITGSAGYDPAVHEPLATSLAGACALLEDAYFVLGYPEDNAFWQSLVPRVLEALEPAIR